MKDLLNDLGPVCAVIGAQWGDEGKGKAIDILAKDFDVIARANGGANAGHTVYVDRKKHIFHLLPSGCLHEGKEIILGSGMVIHLPTLLEEIKTLKDAGIDILDRLTISASAHIVLEDHKKRDEEQEEARDKKIGTTKRGIGPAYEDKASRTGLRMEALWEEKVPAELKEAKEMLADNLAPNMVDLMIGYLEDEATILIEGAQGTLLDIDHGTYPYVTSSSTTTSGALQGLGFPPQVMTGCIGVVKAYCTRVGEGVFPTEVEGEVADRLRERGGEYGATTGRPRRCGWLNLPHLRFAALLNGFSHLNLTKLDVLDEEDVIPVGVDNDENGNTVYEEIPGWKTDTSGITDYKKLPKQARDFIGYIEECVGVSVALIGTGVGRDAMIVRDMSF
jgi:adenylosuccinate synthase